MSKLTPIFVGKVKDGKLIILNRKAFDNYLLSLNGDVTLEVRQWSNRRSLAANAYLWGVVYPIIADYTGHTTVELHNLYRKLFLPPKFTTYKGKEIEVYQSSSQLDSYDFSEYIERIKAEASTMGLYIPEPDRSVS